MKRFDNRIAEMHVVRFVHLCVIFGLQLSSVHGRALSSSDCLDLAIVGGGIGGTYTGWKMKDEGMSIEIFERSDRIGGRLFTVFLPSMPNVGVELGGMRYIPGQHTTMEGVIDKLGLQIVPFKPSAAEKMYYFRGTHLTRDELDTDKLPFSLKPDEPKDPDALRWKFYQEALNTPNPDQITDHTKKVTIDGTPIYKQGYLSVMGDIWSNEAKAYMKCYNAFWSDFENVNAAHSIWGHDPAKGGHDDTVRKTVVGGLNAIPDALAKQFVDASDDNNINLNQRVDAIRKVRKRRKIFYILDIFSSQTIDGFTEDVSSQPRQVCARQVIIAGPRRAQELIQYDPLQNDPVVVEALNSVTDFHAVKIFMTYPSAWWDNLPINQKSLVTDLPLRQTMEFGRYMTEGGQERAMLLHYADDDTTVDYWNELRKFEGTISSDSVPAAYAVSNKVAEHVHYHLADLLNIDVNEIPAALDGAMSIWRDDPFGGAWPYFRPGYNWDEVQRIMRRPSKTDKVFVVSNSYAADDLGSWAEGSLRAANDVLNEFFLPEGLVRTARAVSDESSGGLSE